MAYTPAVPRPLANFYFESIFSAESEARSIKNCPDINDRMIKIMQENILSGYVEYRKREFINCFSSTIDYLKYTKGATFVSL